MKIASGEKEREKSQLRINRGHHESLGQRSRAGVKLFPFWSLLSMAASIFCCFQHFPSFHFLAGKLRKRDVTKIRLSVPGKGGRPCDPTPGSGGGFLSCRTGQKYMKGGVRTLTCSSLVHGQEEDIPLVCTSSDLITFQGTCTHEAVMFQAAVKRERERNTAFPNSYSFDRLTFPPFRK